ncbi:MAG: AAA family ATPase [Methyloprofundus sp.]|nr:AAA family ATPase [Methyloprofundus sp.]
MKIKSIIVENFRSFYGEQEIVLSSDDKKNTTLLYALNGVGKTNLLNAVLWCLHKQFSPGFKKTDDILNNEAKRRNRKSYHVTICFEEGGREYIVKRSGGEIENFRVLMNNDGNYEEIAQEPALFMNSIIPKDMAAYFINDGEGSDLELDSEGMISVRGSIRDILGFNIANKTIHDLGRIRTELRSELERLDKDQELSDIENKLEVFDKSIEEKTLQLDQNKILLEDYRFAKDGVDKKLGSINSFEVKRMQANRKKLEIELASVKRSLVEAEYNKISLIRKYSWVAFSDKLTKEGLDFIDESEVQGRIPAPFNIQLVHDILKESECICGAEISVGSEAYNRIQSLLSEAADPGLINRLQRARGRLIAIDTLADGGAQSIDDNFKLCHRLQDRVSRIGSELEVLSLDLEKFNIVEISDLEIERRNLDAKITATNRDIGRLEDNLKSLKSTRKAKHDESLRLSSLSPRAQFIRNKINIVEEMLLVLKAELDEAEGAIFDNLKSKIDLFLDKYLVQDYKVRITPDFKLGLVDRNDVLVPPSKGQGAILKFIYISSLISIARERRDLASAILTPGAIAPLIIDAPFSHLSKEYAENIARELPKQVDQLVIFMYQDNDKKIDEVLEASGSLGKFYLLTSEISGEPKAGVEIKYYNVNSKKIPSVVYGKNTDRVIVTGVDGYV